MKAIALLLLLANLAVAGYFLGREHWPKLAIQPSGPLHVDRLSLRGQSTYAPATASPAPLPTITCVEWRGLTPDESGAVREALKRMAAGRVMSFSEVPVTTRQWVIFPPLPSPESAAAKRDELVASGLGDTYVVQDEPWRNAISLGLFATADGAQRRVLEAEEKGVHGTRIETVPRQGTVFYFVIRSEDPEALKNLGVIKQAYPNSQQSRVACPP
jgi:hypothetical protein